MVHQNINFRLIVPLISARVRQNLSSVPAQSFAISSRNHSQYLREIIRNIFAQSFAISSRNHSQYLRTIIRNIFAQSFAISSRNHSQHLCEIVNVLPNSFRPFIEGPGKSFLTQKGVDDLGTLYL